MALPHQQERDRADPGPAQLRQHRVPRRRPRLGRTSPEGRRGGQTHHPLGWPHDQAPPGDRPRGPRRKRAGGGLRVRKPPPGGLAEGRLCGGEPTVYRHIAHAPRLGRWVYRRHSGDLEGRPSIGRLRDVLVGQGGGTGSRRQDRTVRLHHHEQPAANVQQTRRSTPHGWKEAAVALVRNPRPSLGRRDGRCGRARRPDGGRKRRTARQPVHRCWRKRRAGRASASRGRSGETGRPDPFESPRWRRPDQYRAS